MLGHERGTHGAGGGTPSAGSPHCRPLSTPPPGTSTLHVFRLHLRPCQNFSLPMVCLTSSRMEEEDKVPRVGIQIPCPSDHDSDSDFDPKNPKPSCAIVMQLQRERERDARSNHKQLEADSRSPSPPLLRLQIKTMLTMSFLNFA